jgi:hypothetical protein
MVSCTAQPKYSFRWNQPEFRREVQHLSALSLLDFPFLGAAFASSKCSGRRRRGRGKSDLSLVSPSAPSVALRVRIHPAVTIARTFPAESLANNDEYEATPAWPHTHTLDVVKDQVFLKFDTGLALIDSVTISGRLQWQRRKRTPEFHILEQVPTGEAFAGAALADLGSSDGGCLR